MSTTVYIFNGISTSIQCSKNQKMKEICDKYCIKIDSNINSLLFLYGGNQLNLDKKYEDYTKENKITILVYQNENEICPKCGKLIDSKKIDNLILSNNNINSTLIGLKSQIDNMINDINNNKKIDEINNQLRNINFIINHIIEDIKKNNEELNKCKIDGLLEKIFNLQTTLSKQAEEIRLLKEENKKLKQVSDGGNQISEAKSNNAQNDDIPEEPNESDDTYEINFRYNNKTFGRRFLSVNTIGQVKAYVKSKTGLSNIYLFIPFPRKVYDDDDALLLDVGLSKRELLTVG